MLKQSPNAVVLVLVGPGASTDTFAELSQEIVTEFVPGTEMIDTYGVVINDTTVDMFGGFLSLPVGHLSGSVEGRRAVDRANGGRN